MDHKSLETAFEGFAGIRQHLEDLIEPGVFIWSEEMIDEFMDDGIKYTGNMTEEEIRERENNKNVIKY